MSIEAEKGMCRHDARTVCWGCFDAVVDAEADRWIAKFKQSGYMTRNREQTRANIVRGLLIGTYQLSPVKPEKVVEVTPDQRQQRAMWRKWTRDSRSRRRAGAA